MKKCPNCGEMNGDDRVSCFQCKTALGGPPQGYHKICPKCGKVFDFKAEACAYCGEHLQVYMQAAPAPAQVPAAPMQGYRSEPEPKAWMYVVTVLFPLFGLLVGAAYIARGDDREGRSFLATAIITIGVCALILLLVSCGGKTYR